MVLPRNRHFGVALTGLRVTGLQVRGYVFQLGRAVATFEATEAVASVVFKTVASVKAITLSSRIFAFDCHDCRNLSRGSMLK